jgi:hypothetical protein
VSHRSSRSHAMHKFSSLNTSALLIICRPTVGNIAIAITTISFRSPRTDLHHIVATSHLQMVLIASSTQVLEVRMVQASVVGGYGEEACVLVGARCSFGLIGYSYLGKSSVIIIF